MEGNYINHNCIECNEDFPFEIIKNDYLNCYENCTFYYFFDKENNYQCTSNSSCPNEYPMLKKNKKECIKYDLEYNLEYLKDIIDKEKNKSELNSNEEKIKYYDNILKTIDKWFESEKYDRTNINNGNDEIIKAEKITITFTTSENQRKNILIFQ